MALTQVTSGGGTGDAGSSSSSTAGTAGIVIAWEYKQERGYDFVSIASVDDVDLGTSKG